MLNMIVQNGITYTNQHANPTSVALMAYVGCLYSFSIDRLVFKHIYTWLELGGVAVCLASSILVGCYKWRESVKEQEEAAVEDDNFSLQ